MDIEINEDISLLDEVKLQARVLFPIVQAMREELGEQRANSIVLNALRGWSRNTIQNLGTKVKGSPREKWTSITTSSMPRIGTDIDIEWIKQDPNEIDFNVTGCRYADFFRGHGEAELGSVLLCDTDLHVAELGAPEVRFSRTQTIMEGAKCCDFRYRIESETETK